MSEEMHGTPSAANESIAICMVTFHRNEGLEKALRSISRMTSLEYLPGDVTVFVVDNSPELLARTTVERIGSDFPFELSYVPCGIGDISSGRNAALDKCDDSFDIVCFLDDDETVCPGWLDGLLRGLAHTPEAVAVTGPVISVMPAEYQGDLHESGAYDRPVPASWTPILAAGSGNVAMRWNLVRGRHARFDQEISELGGEDYLFFRSLTAAGMVIGWAPEAIIYEDVPLSRLTPGWVVKRALRQGNTLAVADRQIFGFVRTVRKRLPRSAVRLCLGTLQLIASPASGRSSWYGLRETCIATGTLLGLAGFRVAEYRRR